MGLKSKTLNLFFLINFWHFIINSFVLQEFYCFLGDVFLFLHHLISYTKYWTVDKVKATTCIVELSKAHAISYNIFINARFHRMKVVGAINVLTYFPIWFNLKFAYICKYFLFIKGHLKLNAMNFDEFNLLSLLISIILKFCQGISKN